MRNRIEVKGLVKFYGNFQVLKGVNLEFSSGEIVGLLGKNGAGKTTTFHCLVGLLAPDHGKILLNGKDITLVPTHKKAKMGLLYLPQENSAFRRATVYENLLLVARENGVVHRVKGVMEKMGLSHLYNQKADTLSGGEMRRLEMARALLLSPRFLFLDEPFSGVDPITVGEIKGMIKSLAAQGIGIVITDHNVEDVFAVASMAYIIDDGRVIARGSPDYLKNHEEVRKRFLG